MKRFMLFILMWASMQYAWLSQLEKKLEMSDTLTADSSEDCKRETLSRNLLSYFIVEIILWYSSAF